MLQMDDLIEPRNSPFEPVVLCCFGRIVPSVAATDHALQFKGI